MAGSETVGQRLRRLRLEAGISQRELAGPGVSYAYISRIEAGTRRPSVKALRVLAERLGVMVEYLETGVNGTATDRLLETVCKRIGNTEIEITVWDDGSVHVRWNRDYGEPSPEYLAAGLEGGESDARDADAPTLTEALRAIIEYEDEADRADAEFVTAHGAVTALADRVQRRKVTE